MVIVVEVLVARRREKSQYSGNRARGRGRSGKDEEMNAAQAIRLATRSSRVVS
jgi:hypothetical protein